MGIVIILGTRPEIIKMSPIIRKCRELGLDYFIIHTGQHYSYNMDKLLFEQLELPKPKYNLEVGSGTHGEQTGKMLAGIEKILLEENPDIVLVEGDTDTVLAGALAAHKLQIKIGHVEAGLRSYDRRMPEEINRILTDHCSDLLFPPTEKSKETLLKEGFDEKTIFMTGNTIVDAVYQNLELANKKVDILKDFNLKQNNYLLITAHREENVDVKENLDRILKGVELLSEEIKLPVIYPIHPRTRKRIQEFNLSIPERIKLIEPTGFLEFLQLEANTKLILTDSGAVQEEACILKIPCVTLRDNTERPETIDVGGNILAGTNPEKILECSKIMLNKERNWENPLGDGKAGERILRIITKKIQKD